MAPLHACIFESKAHVLSIATVLKLSFYMKIGKPVSQRYDVVNGTSATNDFLELLEEDAILDAPKFSNFKRYFCQIIVFGVDNLFFQRIIIR